MKRALAIAVVALGAGMVGTPAAQPAKADSAKGKTIATQACAACHGADGNSPAPANPKLAGQIGDYLQKQLRNYKAVQGKKPERENAIMGAMVANLSAEDMRNLAAYYALQQLKGGVAREKDNVVAGQKLYRAGDAAKAVPACAGCHGPNGAGVPAQYPRLAGQHSEYTETQLKAFRTGDRANDANRMMRSIAARLTDADIRALSDYIAGLR